MAWRFQKLRRPQSRAGKPGDWKGSWAQNEEVSEGGDNARGCGFLQLILSQCLKLKLDQAYLSSYQFSRFRGLIRQVTSEQSPGGDWDLQHLHLQTQLSEGKLCLCTQVSSWVGSGGRCCMSSFEREETVSGGAESVPVFLRATILNLKRPNYILALALPLAGVIGYRENKWRNTFLHILDETHALLPCSKRKDLKGSEAWAKLERWGLSGGQEGRGEEVCQAKAKAF